MLRKLASQYWFHILGPLENKALEETSELRTKFYGLRCTGALNFCLANVPVHGCIVCISSMLPFYPPHPRTTDSSHLAQLHIKQPYCSPS